MGYCFQTVRAMRAVLLAEFSALELRLLCQICKSVRDGLSPLILEQYGIVEDAYDTPLDLIHFTFEEHGFEEGMMFFRYSPLFPSAYKLTLSFSENQQLRANQMMATTNFLTSLQELRSVWPLKKLQFVFRGDFSNMDELLLLDVLLALHHNPGFWNSVGFFDAERSTDDTPNPVSPLRYADLRKDDIDADEMITTRILELRSSRLLLPSLAKWTLQMVSDLSGTVKLTIDNSRLKLHRSEFDQFALEYMDAPSLYHISLSNVLMVSVIDVCAQAPDLRVLRLHDVHLDAFESVDGVQSFGLPNVQEVVADVTVLALILRHHSNDVPLQMTKINIFSEKSLLDPSPNYRFDSSSARDVVTELKRRGLTQLNSLRVTIPIPSMFNGPSLVDSPMTGPCESKLSLDRLSIRTICLDQMPCQCLDILVSKFPAKAEQMQNLSVLTQFLHRTRSYLGYCLLRQLLALSYARIIVPELALITGPHF